jgi:hypothetical protein
MGSPEDESDGACVETCNYRIRRDVAMTTIKGAGAEAGVDQ